MHKANSTHLVTTESNLAAASSTGDGRQISCGRVPPYWIRGRRTFLGAEIHGLGLLMCDYHLNMTRPAYQRPGPVNPGTVILQFPVRAMIILLLADRVIGMIREQ